MAIALFVYQYAMAFNISSFLTHTKPLKDNPNTTFG